MLKSRQAFIYLHPKGLLVGSYSGPGAAVQEDWARGTVWLGSLDAVKPSDLGAAIRAAWARCRDVPLVPYQDVLAKHCEAVGVSSVRRLFEGVKLVSPYLKNGVVTVDATKQTGDGEFEPLLASKVLLGEDASDEELGAAAMHALRISE